MLSQFVRLEYLSGKTVYLVHEEILCLLSLRSLKIFEIHELHTDEVLRNFPVNNLLNCEFDPQNLQVLSGESVRELAIGDRQADLSSYAGCEVLRLSRTSKNATHFLLIFKLYFKVSNEFKFKNQS